MKKIGCFLICAILVMSLTSCSSYNTETATLEGYGDKVFMDMLEDYAEEQIEEEYGGEGEYTIAHVEGWELCKELDDFDLDENEKAITYRIVCDAPSEKVVIRFYTALNTKENTLLIKGLYLNEGGYVTEYYSPYEIHQITDAIF